MQALLGGLLWLGPVSVLAFMGEGVTNKTGRELNTCELRAVYFAAMDLGLYTGPNQPGANLTSVEETLDQGTRIDYIIRFEWTWDGDDNASGTSIAKTYANTIGPRTCERPVPEDFPIINPTR